MLRRLVITPYFQGNQYPVQTRRSGSEKSTPDLKWSNFSASYAITDMISVAGAAAEYIGTTGNENSPKGSAANLLYGVGSDALFSDA